MEIYSVLETEVMDKKDLPEIYSVLSFSSYEKALEDLKKRFYELKNSYREDDIVNDYIDLDEGYFSIEVLLPNGIDITRKIGQIECSTVK